MVAQSKCFKEDRPGNNNVESVVEVGPGSLGWPDLHHAISHVSLRGRGSIFKLKGPRCGFKFSLVSRLGLMGQKILKISCSRTPENGPICQILLCS